jgi:hypothetical protein
VTREQRARFDLMVLAPPASLAAVLFVISLLPSRPNDLFWHMRVGQWILESGAVPATNRFAWTVPEDTPYVYGAWLGGLLLYLLQELGGLELLVFMRNLLAGCLLALVALETHRRSASWGWSAAAVAAVGLLMLNNVAVRPQMFAWVPFAFSVYLLGRYRDGRLPAAWLCISLAGLMVLWVNVHGSFVLGLAVFGACLGGELVERWRTPETGMSVRRVGGLALAVGMMALATLANPLGVGIYGYVRELVGNPGLMLRNTEWAPPTPSGLVFVVFYLSVLALLVVWAHQRRPPAMRDLLLVCGMLWLAWSGARHVLWYAVVAMPVLAEGLARVSKRSVPSVICPQPRWLSALLGILLFVPVLLVQPWFGGSQRLLAHTPVEAVERLRADPGGRLFNEVGFGSYLIWALPEQPVFIDGRIELFPAAIWQDYLTISSGWGALEALERYGVERVLLSKEFHGKLSEALVGSDRWRRDYADAEAELWQKR